MMYYKGTKTPVHHRDRVQLSKPLTKKFGCGQGVVGERRRLITILLDNVVRLDVDCRQIKPLME